jgi:hypothetical protein
MKSRTFKCFTRFIELRAYIPNTLAGNIAEAAAKVAQEIHAATMQPAPWAELQLASNRAGLHFAIAVMPTDGSVIYAYNAGEACGYKDIVRRLEAAGWKECQGN